MPRRRIHLRNPPQNPQHRNPTPLQSLPQQLLMPIRSNLVEDHPPDPHPGVPRSKPMHKSSNRPRLRRGIDHQHHRRPQKLRDLSGGPQLPFPTSPVEQPHDPFDNGDVTPKGPMREQRPDQLRPTEISVKIPPHPPGGERVIPGIDVIRPHFVRGHGKPPRGERGHQPRGNGGLATPGRGSGNDHPRNGLHHSIPRCPFCPASIGCFTFDMSVTRSAKSTSFSGAFRPVMTTCC